jgi:hypothetical protein
MGRLVTRLGAVEEALLDRLAVEMMLEAEIEAMLAVLEGSEDIEPETYAKVVRVVEQHMRADGKVETILHEGGSEEAQRIREEARSSGPAF